MTHIDQNQIITIQEALDAQAAVRDLKIVCRYHPEPAIYIQQPGCSLPTQLAGKYSLNISPTFKCL